MKFAPTVSDVPELMVRAPVVARLAPVVSAEVPFKVSAPPTVVNVEGVVAEALPLRMRFPPIPVTPVMVTVPEPERVRL